MYFRLSGNAALRSWKNVEYACYIQGHPYALPLTMKQAKTLLLCDGEHDLEADDTVLGLAVRNLIVSCEKGEHPSDWLSYKNSTIRISPK